MENKLMARCVEAGLHITVVQRLARHRNIQTTMTYYHHLGFKEKEQGIMALAGLTQACQNQTQRCVPVDKHGQTTFDNRQKAALSAR